MLNGKQVLENSLAVKVETIKKKIKQIPGDASGIEQ